MVPCMTPEPGTRQSAVGAHSDVYGPTGTYGQITPMKWRVGSPVKFDVSPT
jgi:hypothetical protein